MSAIDNKVFQAIEFATQPSNAYRLRPKNTTEIGLKEVKSAAAHIPKLQAAAPLINTDGSAEVLGEMEKQAH